MEKSLILVDASYTSFYRFFATIRWYSLAFAEDFNQLKSNNDYDWVNNEIFMEKYKKMYLDSITKLVKKKIYINSDIIFLMDSHRETLWRTQIKCNYKGDRVDLSLKHNFKSVFAYTYNIMIPEFMNTNSSIYKLRVENMEADDLIAIITLYLEKTNPSRPVYLVSGDADFLQLGRDNLTFINYKSKKPLVLTKEAAKQALKEKILLGDSSDCIPSIFQKGKRINKKEILESDEKLLKYLNENPDAEKNYKLNQQLIDFAYIPKKLVKNVEKQFTKLFT